MLTGILYVFMEVFATSVLGSSMTEKYRFGPLDKTVYEKMAFKPLPERVVENAVYLPPIRRLSLIGSSSLWMFLVGGICGLCLYLLYCAYRDRRGAVFLCFTGSVIITAFEFVAGLLLNGILKLYIWDYTCQTLNFLGQICLFHCALYFFAICPFAFWFFHFLESQYPENRRNLPSLFLYYPSPFRSASKRGASLHPMENLSRHITTPAKGGPLKKTRSSAVIWIHDTSHLS